MTLFCTSSHVFLFFYFCYSIKDINPGLDSVLGGSLSFPMNSILVCIISACCFALCSCGVMLLNISAVPHSVVHKTIVHLLQLQLAKFLLPLSVTWYTISCKSLEQCSNSLCNYKIISHFFCYCCDYTALSVSVCISLFFIIFVSLFPFLFLSYKGKHRICLIILNQPLDKDYLHILWSKVVIDKVQRSILNLPF